MPNRQQKIEEIKKVVGTTRIGLYGHSVCQHWICMIGDVLDRYDNNKKDGFSAFENRGILAGIFDKPRKPIDDQSDECIEYIYDLITK